MAALVADLEFDSHGKPLSPSSAAIKSLRATLRELAAQAAEQVEQEFSDELAATHLSQPSTTDTPELYNGDTTASDSGSSQQSFSSPLGFLQAALPDIHTSKLIEALHNVGGDQYDVDMESVIEALLTSEYVRELEERGIDGLDDDDQAISLNPWETVQLPKKKAAKRKPARAQTISIVDIRQKQHTRPSNAHSVADPWTQLTSLASYVASFLPPHDTSFFLSYFHNPSYASPSVALRAALESIAESQSKDIESETLFIVLDVLRAHSTYETLTLNDKSLLVSDAQLTLAATSGRGEDALDLVWLLHELDADSVSYLERGIYHTAPTSPTAPAPPWSAPPPPPTLVIPKKPPSKPTSPTSATATSATSPTPSPSQWHTIPVRKPPQSYPHSSFIPARTHATARRATVGGNALGKGGKGDVGELSKGRMGLMRERNDLLRQAAGAWKSGSKHNRGGEVAAYFAERAREVQEIARKEQLERVTAMVEATRYFFYHTIDLWGWAEMLHLQNFLADWRQC